MLSLVRSSLLPDKRNKRLDDGFVQAIDPIGDHHRLHGDLFGHRRERPNDHSSTGVLSPCIQRRFHRRYIQYKGDFLSPTVTYNNLWTGR